MTFKNEHLYKLVGAAQTTGIFDFQDYGTIQMNITIEHLVYPENNRNFLLMGATCGQSQFLHMEDPLYRIGQFPLVENRLQELIQQVLDEGTLNQLQSVIFHGKYVVASIEFDPFITDFRNFN